MYSSCRWEYHQARLLVFSSCLIHFLNKLMAIHQFLYPGFSWSLSLKIFSVVESSFDVIINQQFSEKGFKPFPSAETCYLNSSLANSINCSGNLLLAHQLHWRSHLLLIYLRKGKPELNQTDRTSSKDAR